MYNIVLNCNGNVFEIDLTSYEMCILYHKANDRGASEMIYHSTKKSDLHFERLAQQIQCQPRQSTEVANKRETSPDQTI